MIDAPEKEIEGIGEALENDITDIRSPWQAREPRDRYLDQKQRFKKSRERV